MFLALAVTWFFSSFGSAHATVNVQIVPCSNDTIGACAYSYNITMLSTDTISNQSLGVGGANIGTAQWAGTSSPSKGSVSWHTSTPFSFSYTPYAGQSGTDTFTWQIDSNCEYGPRCSSASPGVITITITNPLPPAPSVYDTSLTAPYNFSGQSNSSGVTLPSSGSVNWFGVCSWPSHGSISFSGSWATYTAYAGYYGGDSFSFYANGPGGNSGCATVWVNVQAPPAPSAANGSITTAYNTASTVTLPGSGVINGYGIVGGPSHGSATISGGQVTYTPSNGYVGSDSFTYNANGPGGTSNTATVWVTVQAPPAPTANAGSFSVPYNTAGSTTLSASGAVSSYALVAQPAHGHVTLSGSTATYTPNSGYTGSDTFTFNTTGPGGTSNTATETVTVLTPPSPNNGSLSVPYQTAGSITLTGSGTITSYTIVAQPGHGTVTLSGSKATYTPAAGYYGADSFTFKVTGPNGTSPTTGTISVTVGLPPAPTATAGNMTVPYQTPTTATLAGSGVISSFAIVTQPANGTVSLSGSTVTYTPNPGYIGSDSFTFDVVGPGGTSAPATETVTVQAPPPPVANSGSVTCAYGQACTVTLTSSGYTSGYTLSGQGSLGSCSITGNVLTYTPNWGTVGADSCTFTATGPGGTSNVATVYITNEPPSLPDPGGSTGAAETEVGGTSTAICAAGQATSFPFLPGPPVGTNYDPNWCSEQSLNIGQQALQIQNQLSAITNLQSQVAAAQKQLQGLGSDSTSATVQSVNAKLIGVLQQATGIGFNSASAGANFAAAYPATSTTAGYNGAQLNAALQTWQTNTAAALQNSITVQNQIAQQQGQVTGAVQNAVNASNSAAGPTAATQATNQIVAAVSAQLAQLQDILIASSQAYDVAQASKQQADAAATAVTTQTQAQVTKTVTAPPGVSDTDHM
jgi:P-type conjugative transfer protein TrbJ